MLLVGHEVCIVEEPVELSTEHLLGVSVLPEVDSADLLANMGDELKGKVAVLCEAAFRW